MDVFAFPSLFEGLPNAILEAMAAGVPVVASNIPGTNELIQDGLTGYLVPAGDARPLAEKIARLADDPTRRQALAAAGRQSVIERFSVPAMARAYEALYLGHLAPALLETSLSTERVLPS
jgi:glycosyltransferase involved in cell wall biosynthesis